MGVNKPFRRICNKCFILLLFSFLFTIFGKSQNIFLPDSPGILIFGQFSRVQNFDEPAIGLSYSFNGKTAVGISYGSSSLNSRNYESLSVLTNFLVRNQSQGDEFNVEVVPVFERKYDNLSGQNLSLFSFGAGISRDFSRDSSLNLIPRASLSYLVSPSVGVTNFLSTGIDLGMGLNLTDNVKLIVNPGLNLRLDNGHLNGIITSGLLIY